MSMHLDFTEAVAERTAKRLATDERFIASLVGVTAEGNLPIKEMESELLCERNIVLRLCLCRVPRPEQDLFRQDIEELAAFTGIEANRIAAMIRRNQALFAFKAGTQKDFLAAARDKPNSDNDSRED